jgi:phage repressor protein C with HTH and peptisase S24 domain
MLGDDERLSQVARSNPRQSIATDVDGDAPSEASASKRTRGRTRSKAEAKRKASSQLLMEKIKTFLDDKEVWSEKKDKNKRLDEEEAVRTIQHSSPLKRSMPTSPQQAKKIGACFTN